MGRDEAEKLWNYFEGLPQKAQLEYMNERFGELAFDISRDWDEEQLAEEYKFMKELANRHNDKSNKVCLSLDVINQMFCEEEGILSKFTEVTPDTIMEWLEEKEYLNEEAEDEEWTIIYATKGKDFQEYKYSNGERVPDGAPIGIEKDDELKLLNGIYYSDEADNYEEDEEDDNNGRTNTK